MTRVSRKYLSELRAEGSGWLASCLENCQEYECIEGENAPVRDLDASDEVWQQAISECEDICQKDCYASE